MNIVKQEMEAMKTIIKMLLNCIFYSGVANILDKINNVQQCFLGDHHHTSSSQTGRRMMNATDEQIYLV